MLTKSIFSVPSAYSFVPMPYICIRKQNRSRDASYPEA